MCMMVQNIVERVWNPSHFLECVYSVSTVTCLSDTNRYSSSLRTLKLFTFSRLGNDSFACRELVSRCCSPRTLEVWFKNKVPVSPDNFGERARQGLSNCRSYKIYVLRARTSYQINAVVLRSVIFVKYIRIFLPSRMTDSHFSETLRKITS